MNVDDVKSSSCDLFSKGKFIECCELLQNAIDNCHLNGIAVKDEIEFILLRNNLLVCNCLRIVPEISTEYVGQMTELMNISELYLYEKHVPLELRVNFVCNTLHWYWSKPTDIPDYCYDRVITLVDDCLHEVLYKSGRSIVNSSSHVGKEQDIADCLECLSNRCLSLEPILVVQCLEISQLLSFLFLSRHRFTSLLVNFTMQSIHTMKTIMCAFNRKKSYCIANCFKLGLSKINIFLDTEHIKTIIVNSHVSLCIKHILENEHRQALCVLDTVDQYLDTNDEQLFSLVCYLKALVNFNLEEFEGTLYYLSQMANFFMDPFVKSRCYLLLGRTHSKMGNNESAINTFEKLKTIEFSKVMAYYMSQHYEINNMQFTQMIVLEQAIKGDFDRNNNGYENCFIGYVSKILLILHPQPDLTRRQLLYLAAKKKYEYGSYKLAASTYLNLLKLSEFEQCISDLVQIPSNFMLQHEAVVALLKANEMEEAFKLCQLLINNFEPGCNMWKSDSFWANELNSYSFNVIGAMLMAETALNRNTDTVLEVLTKSFNYLYAKINFGYPTETTSYDESVKTLRRILIGKILLLRATILSKLNLDKDCEAAFQKALTFNPGDEDIVYLYSKWLEHKGNVSQSMDVRGQFDQNKINKITCDNVIMIYVLETKHGLEDSIIGNDVIDDLFVSADNQFMEVDHGIMDPADDDIFHQLFVD